MLSKMMKNAASYLGLFLVFGLLAGMLFNNLALVLFGGLVGHLLTLEASITEVIERRRRITEM